MAAEMPRCLRPGERGDEWTPDKSWAWAGNRWNGIAGGNPARLLDDRLCQEEMKSTFRDRYGSRTHAPRLHVVDWFAIVRFQGHHSREGWIGMSKVEFRSRSTRASPDSLPGSAARNAMF